MLSSYFIRGQSNCDKDHFVWSYTPQLKICILLRAATSSEDHCNSILHLKLNLKNAK